MTITHEQIRAELEKVATHVTFSHTDEFTGNTVWLINEEGERFVVGADAKIETIAPKAIIHMIWEPMIIIPNKSKTIQKIGVFKHLLIDGKLPLDIKLYKKMTFNQMDAIYQSY